MKENAKATGGKTLIKLNCKHPFQRPHLQHMINNQSKTNNATANENYPNYRSKTTQNNTSFTQ
jgi:hypothetical protein